MRLGKGGEEGKIKQRQIGEKLPGKYLGESY